MRVSLVAPSLDSEAIGRHLVAQARLFRERGDEVHLALATAPPALPGDLVNLVTITSEPLPASELWIYHCTGEVPPPTSLRQRDEGLVMVHDHGLACASALPAEENEVRGWLPAHYADLCLVNNSARRDELVRRYGLPPERLCLLPEPDQQAAYSAVLIELVDRTLADDWPPAPCACALDRPRTETGFAVSQAASEATPGQAALRGGLKLAQNQADVMLRDYRVRSRIPLVGGAVAWIRRNLTSHLREPYLDPTLERQVAFNRSVVAWMEQMQARQQALETEIQRLQNLSSDMGSNEQRLTAENAEAAE